MVDSVGDTGDSNLTDDICDDGSGSCTLRAAIEQANATAGIDTIDFDITGTGPHVIAIGPDALPGIDETVHIDGYSEPDAGPNTNGFGQGSNAVISVELDGSGVTNSFLCSGGAFERPGLCLRASAGGSSVRGLSIHSFPGYGIRVIGSGNTIAGNFIGVDSSGADHGNTFVGVAVFPFGSSANNNVIGGTSPADRNVISGNAQAGISISGFGNPADDNEIRNNIIGLDPTGTIAVPNNTGVSLGGNPSNAPGTIIDSNIISGNTGSGVSMSSSVEGSVVTNNRIGTDPSGTVDLGNSGAGVNISSVCQAAGCTDGVTIGSPGAGNLISGNNNNGVTISTSNDNVVQANLIGTDATGLVALPNGATGVSIGGSGISPGLGDDNLVGGPGAGDGNVITSNAYGIKLLVADSNVIEGNLIGIGVDGTTPLGNTIEGVNLGIGADNNEFRGNTIAYSGGDGYRDSSTGNSGNLITRNSIHSNGGLGIDLTFDGVEANDPDDPDTGANGNQNYPVITAVIAGPGGAKISGTLDSVPNSTFTVEFFSSPTADPSGNGEGAVYLGNTAVNTDASGDAAFSTSVPTGVASGHVVTATATDATDNTSEFSAAFNGVAANQDPTIVSAAATSIPENTTAVLDVNATDSEGDTEGAGLSYSLTGGADETSFTIDASNGALSFVAAPDFEDPTDVNTDNDYEVDVTVTDSLGGTGTQSIVVTVTDDNDPPTITSDIAFEVPENTTAVTDVQSTDEDGDLEGAGLTYSLTGGDDQALFGIVPSTGVLSFLAAPDFEVPTDVGTNNGYEVQVTVTDSGGLSDVQDLVVTVTDVEELGPVVIDVQEFVVVTDTPAVLLPIVIEVQESVTVTDEVGVFPPVVITLSEPIGVTDAIGLLPPVVITLSEPIGVTDEVGVFPPVVITLDESILVEDGPVVLPPVVIEIGEGITVTESTAVSVLDVILIDIGGTDPIDVVPTQDLLVTGDGFTPFSSVDIELFSTPILLATTTADSEGSISILVTIPADTPPGSHTIVASEVGGATELSSPLDVGTLPDAPSTSVSDPVLWVQYSDAVVPVVIEASGFDPGTTVTIVALGLPASLSVSTCVPNGDGSTCKAMISGEAGVPQGSYPVDIHAVANDLWSEPVTLLVEVGAESAVVRGLPDRPGRVVFAADFAVTEAPEYPDSPGDISLAALTVTATRLGRGTPIDLACSSTVSGPSLAVSCPTEVLSPGVYRLDASVAGGYYAGSTTRLLVRLRSGIAVRWQR